MNKLGRQLNVNRGRGFGRGIGSGYTRGRGGVPRGRGFSRGRGIRGGRDRGQGLPAGYQNSQSNTAQNSGTGSKNFKSFPSFQRKQ